MEILSRIRGWSLVLLVAVSFGCHRTQPPTQSSAPITGQALVIKPTQSPTDGDSREPDLYATHDGRIILSWVEKIGDKRYALRYAALAAREAPEPSQIGTGQPQPTNGKAQAGNAAGNSNSNTWSEPRTVAEGGDWFVNWADFPSVIALKDGSFAAHWLVKSGTGTYAYNVNIARSNDGKTWSQPIVPHLDNTQTEHGFVSLVALPDGRAGAIWLDGRNMADMKEQADEHAASAQSMTLRYAAIDADGKLSQEAQLDERVCECCQTSAVLTDEGVVAVYRDRSETEVRDISVVRQSKSAWETPTPLHNDNWTINGCPVNGPSIATAGQRVAVAWYTEAGEQPHVKIAFSDNAGASFGSALQVDDGEAIGRVDVVLLQDGSALVCWMSGTAEGGSIKTRRVRQDGAVGPVSEIAKTDISRSSGFPRMARLGNEVHFAWTEFGTPSRVRTAATDVSAYK